MKKEKNANKIVMGDFEDQLRLVFSITGVVLFPGHLRREKIGMQSHPYFFNSIFLLA